MQLQPALLIGSMIVCIILDASKATGQPNYDDWPDNIDQYDYDKQEKEGNQQQDKEDEEDYDKQEKEGNQQQDKEDEEDYNNPPESEKNKEDPEPNDTGNSKSLSDYENEEDYAQDEATQAEDYLQKPEQMVQSSQEQIDSIASEDNHQSLVVKVYRGPTQTINQKPFASWSYFVQYPTDQQPSKMSN